jgi:hypothetical protein
MVFVDGSCYGGYSVDSSQVGHVPDGVEAGNTVMGLTCNVLERDGSQA